MNFGRSWGTGNYSRWVCGNSRLILAPSQQLVMQKIKFNRSGMTGNYWGQVCGNSWLAQASSQWLVTKKRILASPGELGNIVGGNSCLAQPSDQYCNYFCFRIYTKFSTEGTCLIYKYIPITRSVAPINGDHPAISRLPYAAVMPLSCPLIICNVWLSISRVPQSIPFIFLAIPTPIHCLILNIMSYCHISLL